MPRFKPIERGLKLLPVDFDKQVQPVGWGEPANPNIS
jgi:hypothetical protein